MNVNPNPWTIESIITHAKEMAERNRFELLPGEGGVIKIVAKKPPYGRNVSIAQGVILLLQNVRACHLLAQPPKLGRRIEPLRFQLFGRTSAR